MPVQYNVDSNLLTDPPSHYPRVAPALTLDLTDIADLINLHNPNVPAGTASMCIELFIEEVKNQLAEGNWVKLDSFCSFSTSIVNGSLENPADPLPGTAKVELRFKPSAPFKLSVQELATYERVGYTNKTPQVVAVKDVSLDVNKVIESDSALDVSGSNIGFNQAAADEGVFILVDGASEVKASNVARNKPSNIIVIPSLDAAVAGATAAKVICRSRYTTNGQLKEGVFQYARIPNAITDAVNPSPILKPYGSAAVATLSAPAMPANLLLTMRLNTSGQAVMYGQSVGAGGLGAATADVIIAEGANAINIGATDYTVNVASLTALVAALEAEGRFVQEYLAIDV